MATFVWRQDMFGGKRWCQNNPGSNGHLLTSPGPLLLTLKVKYIILKNKPLKN
jgi:hypothetical protein